MEFIDTGDVTIACECFGATGDAPLLLIAGLGTQMLRWSPEFCTKLAERGFRVIRFDNRDAGLSTHFADRPAPDFAALTAAATGTATSVEFPYTLNDMARDIIGLLDTLNIDKAHVVGRSMGGMIAQLVACSYPSRVRSLAAIMSSTGNPTLPNAAPDVMAMMMRPSPSPSIDFDTYFANSLAFARRIEGTGYPVDADAYRSIIFEESNRSHDPGGLARQIAAIAATGDLRPKLSNVTAPTLVIHGADDPLIPLAAGTDIAGSITDARLMTIEGMGHEIPPALYEHIIQAIAANAQRQS